MRRISLAVIGFAALAGAACATTAQDAERPARQPVLTGEFRLSDGSPAGTVEMFRGPLGLLFRIEGEGWPGGWHGAHLHAVGACEGPDFQSAGGHVNHPEAERPHGLLNWEGGPDYGDLQNVYAHADGTVRAEVYFSAGGLPHARGFDLAGDRGLSMVIHENPDDHESQPIGGAGARIACAVLAPAP